MAPDACWPAPAGFLVLLPDPGAAATCASGKYSRDNLPAGPRGQLFKQLLPEVEPLLQVGLLCRAR